MPSSSLSQRANSLPSRVRGLLAGAFSALLSIAPAVMGMWSMWARRARGASTLFLVGHGSTALVMSTRLAVLFLVGHGSTALVMSTRLAVGSSATTVRGPATSAGSV